MFAYCGNNPVMGYDPDGTLNWGKLFSGSKLLAVGLVACATALTAVSGGACAPLMVLACATFVAGGMTVLNGASEVIESVTDYNPMRDTIMGGNEEAYEKQKNFFETAAEVGTTALNIASSFNLCFREGTLVAAEDGSIPIECIQAGMLVWATNEITGEKDTKEVVQLFRNETSEWIHLTIRGEEIICTPEHPFYSPVKGWTAACNLRAGDILVTLNGEYVVLERIQHELLEKPETTYNFEVEEYHTYYVGSTEVLVHNSCGDIGSYSSLKSSGAGKGNEVHHIIEKRFAQILDINPNQMPSIVLDHSTHLNYTQLWREAIPYGSTPTAGAILRAAETIYNNSSELLAWARFTIVGG